MRQTMTYGMNPNTPFLRRAGRLDLEQAIAALPDENRVAVSMFYMGDCTLKEISDFLGVSVNTVKTKLHRARQQLGRSLSERYGKVLKSRKLRGGFLMQMMEQLRHTPMPTMGFAWERCNRWEDRIFADYGIVHPDWSYWSAKPTRRQSLQHIKSGWYRQVRVASQLMSHFLRPTSTQRVRRSRVFRFRRENAR